jgi:hypothetical protein
MQAMIFFLVFPFLAWTLAMLTIAAIAYTVSVAVPAFRRFAITAPISAFFISPALLFPLGVAIYSRMYLLQPPFTSNAFWVRTGAAFSLLLVGCVFAAGLANLAVRAVFQLLPNWLYRIFGLRENLLLQSSILAGGSLSVLVMLTVAILGVYSVPNNLLANLLCAGAGLASSAICLRSMLRLAEPQVYQPQPLPAWSNRILFPNR